MRIRIFALFISFLILSASCSTNDVDSPMELLTPSHCDVDAVQALIQSELMPDSGDMQLDTLVVPVTRNSSYLDSIADKFYLRRFANGEGLVWVGSRGLKNAYKEFEKFAQAANLHGLYGFMYIDHEDSLLNLVHQNFENGDDVPVEAAKTLERQLTKNFLRLTSDLLYGFYNPRKFFNHKIWSASNDSTYQVQWAFDIINSDGGAQILLDTLTPNHQWYKALVVQMKNYFKYLQYHDGKKIKYSNRLITGDSTETVYQIYKALALLNGQDTSSASYVYDEKLRSYVSNFQRMNRLEPTGIVDERVVNELNKPITKRMGTLRRDFERWHWSKRDFENEYMLVNIPAFRLYKYKNDSVEMRMNCMVGKTSRKTPTVDALMTDIVINPTWTVPPTILKKDILPSIQRRGGYAVSRRGLTAYDRRGRKVSPGRINSSNYRYFRYVQKPSYNNALGTVKFNMPNRELVYIHDTNHRWGFTNSVRAVSSGCVRIQHPRDLATLVLGQQGYTREKIDSLISKKNLMSVKLDREIYSHFMYLTSAPDSTGTLVFYPDVYDMDDVFTSVFKKI